MKRFYFILCTVACVHFIEGSNLNFNAKCPGVAIPECMKYDSPEPDYYWRPYNGNVPDDAIVGGHDKHKNVTYIGQIPINSFSALNPGTIYPCNKVASTTYSGVYFQDKDVKILCSRNPNKFKWINATTDGLFLITDYYLIVGGFEFVDNRFLIIYVGRTKYEDSLIVGKVLTHESVHGGLKIPTPNGNQINTHSFELLVYEKS